MIRIHIFKPKLGTCFYRNLSHLIDVNKGFISIYPTFYCAKKRYDK